MFALPAIFNFFSFFFSFSLFLLLFSGFDFAWEIFFFPLPLPSFLANKQGAIIWIMDCHAITSFCPCFNIDFYRDLATYVAST